MNLSVYLRRVYCTACDWQAVWGPEQMLEGLRELQMLRREKQPHAETIVHLAESAASRLRCTACQHTGLRFRPWSDEFDDPRPRRACELCGEQISSERLEIFPQTLRCARCQDKPDPATHEEDFCPRCGGHVQVRLASDSGVSRYRVTCPACGWKG